MSTVEEITAAIAQLSANDVVRVQPWLAELSTVPLLVDLAGRSISADPATPRGFRPFSKRPADGLAPSHVPIR